MFLITQILFKRFKDDNLVTFSYNSIYSKNQPVQVFLQTKIEPPTKLIIYLVI